MASASSAFFPAASGPAMPSSHPRDCRKRSASAPCPRLSRTAGGRTRARSRASALQRLQWEGSDTAYPRSRRRIFRPGPGSSAAGRRLITVRTPAAGSFAAPRPRAGRSHAGANPPRYATASAQAHRQQPLRRPPAALAPPAAAAAPQGTGSLSWNPPSDVQQIIPIACHRPNVPAGSERLDDLLDHLLRIREQHDRLVEVEHLVVHARIADARPSSA